MPVSRGPIAKSRYRQVKVTFTHEVNGRLSYRVHAKALNAAWSEQTVIATGSCDGTTLPLNSTEDALSALVYLLEDQLLPSIARPPS